jgi:hypothetical protein
MATEPVVFTEHLRISICLKPNFGVQHTSKIPTNSKSQNEVQYETIALSIGKSPRSV